MKKKKVCYFDLSMHESQKISTVVENHRRAIEIIIKPDGGGGGWWRKWGKVVFFVKLASSREKNLPHIFIEYFIL